MRASTVFVALAALVAAVYGADDDCVYKKGGTRYDLRALRANKDYEFTSPYSDRKYKLNVCGPVKTELWNPDVAEDKVGAFYTGDKGDLAIGGVNTTLDVVGKASGSGPHSEGGAGPGALVMLMTGGTKCKGGGNAATAVRFMCDGGAGNGKPILVAQLPPADDEACSFFVEWRTAHACPAYPGIGSFFTFILTVLLLLLFAILAYLFLFLAYARFVVGQPVELTDATDSLRERIAGIKDFALNIWDSVFNRRGSGRYSSYARGGANGFGGSLGGGTGNGGGGLRRGIPRSWQSGGGAAQGYVGLPTDEEHAGLLNEDDDDTPEMGAPVPAPQRAAAGQPSSVSHQFQTQPSSVNHQAQAQPSSVSHQFQTQQQPSSVSHQFQTQPQPQPSSVSHQFQAQPSSVSHQAQVQTSNASHQFQPRSAGHAFQRYSPSATPAPASVSTPTPAASGPFTLEEEEDEHDLDERDRAGPAEVQIPETTAPRSGGGRIQL